MVHIYTGKGKGKTTAAMGAALRAIGQGLKVYIAVFLKPIAPAELMVASQLKPYLNFDLYPDDDLASEQEKSCEIEKERRKANFSGWILRDKITAKERQKATQYWEKARTVMLSGQFQLVILDEIIVAGALGLISTDQIRRLIEEKPPDVELIMTGRGATPELIALADIVTEMKEVKHPFQEGLKARKGIEF